MSYQPHSRTVWDPVAGAQLSVGADALDAVERFVQRASYRDEHPVIATDIETPGLDRQFDVNCVTCAWRWADGNVQAVLLDPADNALHARALGDLYAAADRIVLHNAGFDTPALYRHGWVSRDDIHKMTDTLLLTRFAHPGDFGNKLEQLAPRHLGMPDGAGEMERAFAAAGFANRDAGYRGMTTRSPIYRTGAMLDTVATLKLESVLREQCISTALDHDFGARGATTRGEAEDLLATQETVNRVMLVRTAVGLAVDLTAADRYRETMDADRVRFTEKLTAVGLVGGSGKGSDILDYLLSIGELPEPWPRTPKTGALKATKDLMEELDHPLAEAQRQLALMDKMEVYLDKVAAQAAVTGRCHPQVNVLGAAATGRMSYSSPELQQFPGPARSIIIDDGQGLTSIDWSQIEPVTMAAMAQDTAFIAPFEAGGDLYEPIQRSCGLPLDKSGRDIAKVVLLATMYGQGINSLARRIKHTPESANQIRRQMFGAMKASERFMSRVQNIAKRQGCIITIGGRILPVDKVVTYKAVNYICQGSAYDVLAHTIERMHHDGLGEYLQLALHDEVVVDTEVAAEVQQIMLTPPPFMVRWAERTPVLRTDRADMGGVWQKV